MKIWIDADACPRTVREIVFRASERLALPVCLVANSNMTRHHSRLITSVMVADDFDAADDYISENAASLDLVITADIPLAARIVAKGALGLDPRGEMYTEENVGERLTIRDMMQELRATGLVYGGPGQLNTADRRRFASSLDSLLTRMIGGRS